MNKINELKRLSNELKGISAQKFWPKRKDNILITQPNGKRYQWNRINPDSEKAKNKIKQMKERRK